MTNPNPNKNPLSFELDVDLRSFRGFLGDLCHESRKIRFCHFLLKRFFSASNEGKKWSTGQDRIGATLSEGEKPSTAKFSPSFFALRNIALSNFISINGE